MKNNGMMMEYRTANATMRDAMTASLHTSTKTPRNRKTGRLATLLTLVMGLLLLGSGLALADTVTIRPDSVSATGGWSGVTVGNLSDQSDATLATITGVLSTFTLGLENNALYTGATINQITITVRSNVVGGGGAAERINAGPTGALLTAQTLADSPAFGDLAFISTGPFTPTDIDNLVIDVATTALAAGETAQVFDVWVVVDYTPPAGGANELADCGSCHTYGPTDGIRGTSTGAVVGSHTAHSAYVCSTCHVTPATETQADFDHRSGTIQMAANIQGGFYDKNGNTLDDDGPFNQTNSTTLASCENVACHNSTTTPAWGGTATCDTCHSLPPATNAHTTHYTAKGWTTGVTTNCTACHPDNELGPHSSVTDGAVEISLTRTGTGGSTSCSTWTTGCHNDATSTPTWSTTGITCGSCHTISGTNSATVANPASGLHDETPSVSGVIHNPSNANFSGCEDCHTGNPSPTHWNGTSDTPTVFDPVLGYSAGTPPTCTATCHSESGTSGPWARLWHENSDLTDGSECAGCHGSWSLASGWNAGVQHRGNPVATDPQPQTTHGTGTYECKDCHGLEAATGYTYTAVSNDWGGTSNHGNAAITMNNNGTSVARGTGGNAGKTGCTNACHSNGYDGVAAGSHSFTTTGWAWETVSGDTINAGCDSCHGGGGQYWPAGTSYPNTEERHDEHMAQISAKLGITLPGTDLEQKRMCQYCHLDPGGSGHNTDSGDSVADVTNFNPIWDATNPPSAGDASASFNATNGSCSSIDCHNNKATGTGTYGWRDAGTASCTMCHTAGGGVAGEFINPTSSLHDTVPTISGVIHDDTLDASGCVICHTATPSTAHLDGNPDTSAPTIQFAGTVGFSDGTPPTCANNCHAESSTGVNWGRKWHEGSTNATGACAGCHGDWANGWNANVRHRTTTNAQSTHGNGTTYECGDCHVLEASTANYTFTFGGNDWGGASNHGDGNITMNDDGGGTITDWQRGTGGNSAKSMCLKCHTVWTDNPPHWFVNTTWPADEIIGDSINASCTGCHNAAGSGAAGVGPDSPHSNNVTGYTCEGCHTGHNAGVIEIPNYGTIVNFSANGEGGINLGGADTSGTTEAEICWNCHGTTHSEWGTNTGGSYNYGSVSTPNWATATWSSANFSYKNGSLTSPPGGQSGSSMHDTLRVPWPASTSDTVGEVGCSYCHDVHDTQGPNGKPYLRGTWNPNPYPEDGAPRSGDTYTAGGNPYGAVPRGNTATTGPGAYQIDQNNGNPNGALGTYASVDGLCATCHDAATLKSRAPLHTNPLGYSDFANDTSAARNIFKQTDRSAALTRFDPGMAYQNTLTSTLGDPSKGWGGGLRNKDFDAGIAVDPTLGGRYGYQAGTFEWGVTMNDTTVDADFHNFTCSKCHTPHASRLPRLMITNCLDTQNNTWDDALSSNANWSNWPNLTPGNNKQLSQAHTAQNCHRYTGEASGPGWNTVTPW